MTRAAGVQMALKNLKGSKKPVDNKLIPKEYNNYIQTYLWTEQNVCKSCLIVNYVSNYYLIAFKSTSEPNY